MFLLQKSKYNKAIGKLKKKEAVVECNSQKGEFFSIYTFYVLNLIVNSGLS